MYYNKFHCVPTAISNIFWTKVKFWRYCQIHRGWKQQQQKKNDSRSNQSHHRTVSYPLLKLSGNNCAHSIRFSAGNIQESQLRAAIVSELKAFWSYCKIIKGPEKYHSGVAAIMCPSIIDRHSKALRPPPTWPLCGVMYCNDTSHSWFFFPVCS